MAAKRKARAMRDGVTWSTLGDMASFVSGGTPAKSNSSYWSGDIPWVSAKDMKSVRLRDAEDHITADALESGSKLAPAQSTLLLIRGMTLLSDVPICLIERDMAFNQDVKAIIAKGGVDSRFLNFALRAAKSELLRMVDLAGHGTGRLPTDQLRALRLPRPPLPRQRVIAEMLDTLDGKIEVNCRMNETLQATAKALFKASFASAPHGFKGWRQSTIGEEVKVVGGSTPSTRNPEFWEGGSVSWATPKDLSKLETPFLLRTERRITDSGLAQIGSGLLPAGTVLLSSRAPIGYLAISEIPIAINQGFIAMVCNTRIPPLYAWLWAEQNMDKIKGRANGTTFQEISKANFRPIRVDVPPKPLLDRFIEAAEPLRRRIVVNVQESVSLARIRDSLMPRLLSGETRWS